LSSRKGAPQSFTWSQSLRTDQGNSDGDVHEPVRGLEREVAIPPYISGQFGRVRDANASYWFRLVAIPPYSSGQFGRSITPAIKRTIIGVAIPPYSSGQFGSFILVQRLSMSSRTRIHGPSSCSTRNGAALLKTRQRKSLQPIRQVEGHVGLAFGFLELTPPGEPSTGPTGRESPAQGRGRRPTPWEKGHPILAA
jgi:hypothetical protein